MLIFISGVEIVFILLAVVVLFGADKIPEIAHGLGKAIRQIRMASDEIKEEIHKSAEKHGMDKEIKQISERVNNAKDNIEKATKPIKRTLE